MSKKLQCGRPHASETKMQTGLSCLRSNDYIAVVANKNQLFRRSLRSLRNVMKTRYDKILLRVWF